MLHIKMYIAENAKHSLGFVKYLNSMPHPTLLQTGLIQNWTEVQALFPLCFRLTLPESIFKKEKKKAQTLSWWLKNYKNKVFTTLVWMQWSTVEVWLPSRQRNESCIGLVTDIHWDCTAKRDLKRLHDVNVQKEIEPG